MAQRIKPFSNATEAMWWMERNCDKCHRVKCYAKSCIELGFITGEITLKMANWIGYENNRLVSNCNNFNKPNKNTRNLAILTDKFQYNLF
jgi:hypothetical protein